MPARKKDESAPEGAVKPKKTTTRKTAKAAAPVEAVEEPKAPATEMEMPSPEEVEAALQGANRTHSEGLGDAWAVVTGMNPAAVIPQVVGTVLHEGATRPSWQWKGKGQDHVLMVWPKDQPIRAAVLMSGEEGQKLAPTNAVPLLEGVPNDLTVESVHPWEKGFGADVAVMMMEGKNPMWFYDPLYGRDKDDLTPGVTHTFLLAGLAMGVRKALLDEVTYTRGPRFEAHAEAWLAENPGKKRMDVPPLKVSLAGSHMIMPGRRFCEYQVRGVIDTIDDCMLDKMPFKVFYLTFPFDNREPVRLPVYASRMVLGDFEPELGQQVDAYVWLQGRVIDFEPQEQA